MRSYTVYSIKTGQVVRTGQCQDDMLDYQAGDGEAAIDGDFPDDVFYFVSGHPAAIPPRGSVSQVFDTKTGKWVDPRSRAEVEAQEKAAATAEAIAYLTSTDWMIIRLLEDGTDIPADVLAKRAAAREIASTTPTVKE